MDLRAERSFWIFWRDSWAARLNSAERARRLTVTDDGKLARGPLFKSSGYKRGIKAKSHSEILAAEACQARLPCVLMWIERKKKKDKGKRPRGRETNRWHAIDERERSTRKIYLIKFRRCRCKDRQRIRLSYTSFDTSWRSSLAREVGRTRKDIQKSGVRIITMAFRA